jgi:hypothetical protein
VITPTCDRPVGLALAEQFVRRQTRPPDEWIVVDGGEQPAVCTMGQRHLRTAWPPGVENFLGNLQAGLQEASGEVIAFIEDDDWYAPTHLEQLLALLADPMMLAAGDDDQRYYHVGYRQWRTWKNTGACLCQTGLRRQALPRLEAVIRVCLERRSYGVDTNFWRGISPSRRAIAKTHTVVGIKGLPGRHGLGVGHRPDGKWHADPELAQLQDWIGEDSAIYADFYQPRVVA